MKKQTQLEFAEAEKIFHGIFDRGTQWEYAEDTNEHLAIEDVQRDDHWCNYGNHQAVAAKIFNDMNLGWKVIKLDMYGDAIRDYFDDSYDFDEYSLSIAKAKKKKGKHVKITIHQTGYVKEEFDELIKKYGKENVTIIPKVKK
jgi:hypothetical protein